jgi:hypothetical protein
MSDQDPKKNTLDKYFELGEGESALRIQDNENLSGLRYVVYAYWLDEKEGKKKGAFAKEIGVSASYLSEVLDMDHPKKISDNMYKTIIAYLSRPEVIEKAKQLAEGYRANPDELAQRVRTHYTSGTRLPVVRKEQSIADSAGDAGAIPAQSVINVNVEAKAAAGAQVPQYAGATVQETPAKRKKSNGSRKPSLTKEDIASVINDILSQKGFASQTEVDKKADITYVNGKLSQRQDGNTPEPGNYESEEDSQNSLILVGEAREK